MRLWMWIFSLGLLLGLGGCEKPLFTESQPRTQYERFDRIRGVYTPRDAVGPTGETQPALRERLTPYN